MRKSSVLGMGVLSIGIWMLIGLSTVFYTLLICVSSLVLFPLDRQRRLAHRLATWWARSIIRGVPVWRLHISGRKNLPATPAILVSNHQSLFDIMVLFCLNCQFKWVAKASLFAIPFLGWSMALAGYIRLVRERHGSIRQTYDEATRWLASGVSVLFFPEGTRSRTGELGPFKNGAFKLALKTGRPIVPIVVTGTRELLARGSWIFRPGADLRVAVLPAVDPAACPHADRLREAVRQRIADQLRTGSTSS